MYLLQAKWSPTFLCCDPNKQLDWTILIGEAKAEACSLKWFSAAEAIDGQEGCRAVVQFLAAVTRLYSFTAPKVHPSQDKRSSTTGSMLRWAKLLWRHPKTGLTVGHFVLYSTLNRQTNSLWQTIKLCHTARFDPQREVPPHQEALFVTSSPPPYISSGNLPLPLKTLLCETKTLLELIWITTGLWSGFASQLSSKFNWFCTDWSK